jgi:spectrin beta
MLFITVRNQGNLHFDKDNLEQRQFFLNNSYKNLCDKSQNRKKNLEDAIKLYKFYAECDTFEVWMKEKEVLLTAKESLATNIEATRRKFEGLITDIAANAHILDEINKMADDMVHAGHQQKPAITKRQKEINDRWNNLHKLRLNKEKTLQGASSLELFGSMCDELGNWIIEKQGQVNNNDLGKDLKSVQALQRRHQNLESELGALQDKVAKMNLLANA